jgi:PAS domain S-box-containing protein
LILQIDRSNEAEAKLRNAYDELEKMVEERTCDLEEKTILLEREIEDRTKAEALTEKTHMITKEMLERSPFGIYVVNKEGVIEFVNPAMLDLSGATYEKFTEQNAFSLPTYIDIGLADKIRSAINGKPFFMGPVEYKSYFGNKITVRNFTGIPYESEGEKKAIIFVEDITESKRMEDALRASEEVYRMMFESNPFPMMVFDRETLEILEVNDAAVDHYGYSREEFLSMTIKDIRPPEEVPKLVNVLSEMTGGIYRAGSFKHLKKDGTVIDVEITSHEIDFNGRRAQLALAYDITERKRAEDELRQSKDRLQLLINRMPIGCVVWSTDFHVEMWNPSAEEIFGYTEKEAIGKHPYGFIVPKDIQKDVDPVLDRLSKGDLTAHSVNDNITKDGSRINCEWFNTPLKDVDGSTIGIISMVSDITENVKLQSEAFKSAQLASLGELAAGVAHEVNNPVNVILLNAEIFLDKYCRSEEEKKVLTQILNESNRITKIIKSLLSFSRTDKKEKRYVSIADLISDTLILTKNILRKESINLKVNVIEDLPDIYANQQQIEQVFINVINNSRYSLNEKYNGANEDKVIEIRTENIGIDGRDYVRTTLYDNGSGMSGEVMEKALNPFYTTKPGHGGTGLGLSISHSIIEDHRGRLSIESKEDQYTKVMIDLPVGEVKDD